MIQAEATVVTVVAAAVETTRGQLLAEMEVNQVIMLEGQVIGVIALLNKILQEMMMDMIARMITLKFITATMAIFKI